MRRCENSFMTTPGIMELDLHGKNQYQARIAIESALRKATSATYRLRLIHGFNSGTRLRDMIRDEFADHPKVRRIVAGLNDGVTDLILRELIG